MEVGDEQRLSEFCDKLFGDDDSGISGNQRSHVLVKAMEFYRQSSKACSDYLPITRLYACLHLAARSLGISCRLDSMVKRLPSFNTTNVQDASRAITAVLGLKLNDMIDMKTICIQFGCTHFLAEAERFVQFVDNELRLTQRNASAKPALIAASFIAICTALRVKRIDQKRLCELVECLPRDFKKIKTVIDRNESCQQYLFNINDPSSASSLTKTARKTDLKRKQAPGSEAADPAEDAGNQSETVKANNRVAGHNLQPCNGIHSMIGFEGWNQGQKFRNYLQWRENFLRTLPFPSTDHSNASASRKQQEKFEANPFSPILNKF